MVTTTIDTSLDLTIHKCSGSILATDIKEIIEVFYKEKPTLNVLWDFTDTEPSSFGYEDIQNLARSISSIAHSREQGKTALAATSDLSYGLSRMYQTLGDESKQQGKIRVFRSVDEAIAWIKK
jgi:hypothetical protein